MVFAMKPSVSGGSECRRKNHANPTGQGNYPNLRKLGHLFKFRRTLVLQIYSSISAILLVSCFSHRGGGGGARSEPPAAPPLGEKHCGGFRGQIACLAQAILLRYHSGKFRGFANADYYQKAVLYTAIFRTSVYRCQTVVMGVKLANDKNYRTHG